MIPGYFYLRQRLPLLGYLVYLILDYGGFNEVHKKKVSNVIVYSVAAYWVIVLGGYVYDCTIGSFPVSRLFPYNWSYHAILTWGFFFIVIYRNVLRNTGKYLYSLNFAGQSVLAAGWLHEIIYFHPREMFVSANAVFGINSQIIALGIIVFELKKMRAGLTKSLVAAGLLYVGFALILMNDVTQFRRIIWVYRIPAGLIFVALTDSLKGSPKQKDHLKILHVWNTAGVAGFIARDMDKKHGTKSKVLMRASGDPYGCMVNGNNLEDRGSVFILRALAHIPFYEIIHIHGLEKMIPLIKLVIPWKPLFLHYHGSNIRGLWAEKRKYWKWADQVFVSTPDLLAGAPGFARAKAIWIPNIVNEELCRITKYHSRIEDFKFGWAFSDSRWAENEAEELARIHDYKIEFGFRTLTEGLPHHEYLAKIVNYPAYVDVKRDFPGYGDGEIIEAHSLTGLEMLFMGGYVIRWDGELIEDFPEEHRSEYVVKMLYKIYRSYAK